MPRAPHKQHGPLRPKASRPNSTARGYGYRWQQYRLGFLANHPLCVRCSTLDRPVPATDVDHVRAVSGPHDPLFWRTNNHQALCESCHSIKTNTEDRGTGRRR